MNEAALAATARTARSSLSGRPKMSSLIPLLAVVLIGAWLRLFGIGERDFWWDEGFSIDVMLRPFASLFEPSLVDSGNQLLFHLIAHPWARLVWTIGYLDREFGRGA